jgi:hypothetical protein
MDDEASHQPQPGGAHPPDDEGEGVELVHQT